MPRETIATLRAENTALRAANAALREGNAALHCDKTILTDKCRRLQGSNAFLLDAARRTPPFNEAFFVLVRSTLKQWKTVAVVILVAFVLATSGMMAFHSANPTPAATPNTTAQCEPCTCDPAPPLLCEPDVLHGQVCNIKLFSKRPARALRPALRPAFARSKASSN